jgi:hypothetical protein
MWGLSLISEFIGFRAIVMLFRQKYRVQYNAETQGYFIYKQ